MMPNYDYSKDLTSDNKNGLVYVIDDDADVTRIDQVAA